ncbi:MAG: AglZ/HisF2 family acetamidino modification protein [Deltaproteobacteria bacterium]
MLRARIIPCLLVRNKGLVKTVNFSDEKYVGDPINAVRIFNEKEVDELMVIDIDATVQGREPDFKMIADLAAECRMPLCYGGGIKSADQARRIMSLGVEKVALSSGIIARPDLISEIATEVGSQSVVAVLDVRKTRSENSYTVWTHNGKIDTGLCPIALAKDFETRGAGEIVVYSIDNDGVMKGYNMDLVDKVRSAVHLPITVLGGAGSLLDIGQVIQKYGSIGVSAGSLFVFKGVYRAVLINYPSHLERDQLQQKPL